MTPSRAESLLGVGDTANPAQVRAAFRAAARRHHPDTSGDGRNRDLGMLVEARDVLMDRIANSCESRRTALPAARRVVVRTRLRSRWRRRLGHVLMRGRRERRRLR
jgi:hypothetical protein